MTLGLLSRARWNVLEPLLDGALEVEPALRSKFLDEACGDDTGLRAELGALVAACELGDTLLADPAAVTYAPLLAETVKPLPALLGGRYRIVREIGRGGMGTVYLADDQKHGRQVAVKTLHTEVAQIIGRDRFAREIEIAAGLSHPHILPLHDSGEVTLDEDEEPTFLYFITPFAAGESLRERLVREPKLPPEEAVRLGREIALALDYAHRRGVIHLDVKPGNILLHEGHAIIADFGIARAISSGDDEKLARSTPLLGTPSYMSPEQALGAPNVDGRSDVYSLGCVVYEMLTGERPFARESLMDVIAAAKARVPPDGTLLQRTVPRELAAVVLRAIAPAREDRYHSARELANALGDAMRHGKRRRNWTRIGITVASVAAVAASAVAVWRFNHAAVLDTDLVAVAPFDVASSSLGLWKEGMVDVMSRSLDGAGALRAVPASIVVHRWRGRADAQSARALGKATGARLVLFGGLLAAGDSVRAAASLLDAQTGRTLAEFEQRDIPARIDRLADSLTLSVLRELGRTRRIDLAHATSSATVSLAALKTYLQGEQFYRAAAWDSAQTHFEHAIALDTTFALAYHRLAAVRRWRDASDRPDSMAYALMRKPSQFPRGLGPRERLLATIDSLSAETYFAWRSALRDGDYDDEAALVDSLCSVLIEAQRRYPNDPELAFLHAEVRADYDRDVVAGELDDRGTLARYDRAIALDSGFAPAYARPITLAAYLDGAESARRYTRAYLALAPSGHRSQLIRLADELLDPSRSSSIDAAHLVDSLSADELCEATTLLRHIADSTVMVVRIARAVTAKHLADTLAGKPFTPLCAFSQIVNGLQFRGHLREAERLVSLAAHESGPAVMYNMARFNMVPTDSTRAEFKKILALAPKTRITKLFGWWATDGDTAAIETYITGFAAANSRPRTPSVDAMLRASISAGQAYLALARRDTVAALRRFIATKDTLHECWYENRVALVQLLAATGRYTEAAERLERRWPGTTSCSNGVDDVIWTMERARVFDRLGRRAEAITNYQFVMDAWRSADPELQPWVREARTAVTRLRSGGANTTLASGGVRRR